MHDRRFDELADVLIGHSTKLQAGEHILIETFDIPDEMVIALIRATRRAGGVPLVESKRNRIQRELIARETLTIKSPAFPIYERLYLAQAYWQHPDDELFKRWFEAERGLLLGSQESSGAWLDPRFGASYATATNALVLALPESLLPIFQR